GERGEGVRTLTDRTGRFPDQVRATHAGLERVFHFEDPGLYFMPISEGIVNKRTEQLIRGFFLAIGDGFSGLDSDPVTSIPLDSELLARIKTLEFSDEFQGIPITVEELLIEDEAATFRYVRR